MERTAPSRHLGLLIANAIWASLVLGLTTYAVWLLVGRETFQGGIVATIANRGLLIFGLLGVAWAAVGFGAGRWPWRGRNSAFVALVITLAWLVQGAIVVLFGQLLNDDLRTVLFRASVWLTATGVVLQPISVFVGARAGVSVASRSHRTTPATATPDRDPRP